jgi:hypothetical protein
MLFGLVVSGPLRSDLRKVWRVFSYGDDSRNASRLARLMSGKARSLLQAAQCLFRVTAPTMRRVYPSWWQNVDYSVDSTLAATILPRPRV